MNVESITAICILVAWILVVYRVEGLPMRRTRPVVIARHLVMGTALAIALVAPGAWGKLSLAIGVLVVYALSLTPAAQAPTAGNGRQVVNALVVSMTGHVDKGAIERDRIEGLARARQRNG